MMKQSTKSPANNGAPDGAARSSRMIAIAGAITFVASVVVPGITAGSDNGPDPVVATVGDHQVTLAFDAKRVIDFGQFAFGKLHVDDRTQNLCHMPVGMVSVG